jgi:protein gp37
MADNSKIEWTEATWNPCTGCTKISLGCKNCYAERLSIRLKNMNKPKYKNGFKLTLHEDALNIPLNWLTPRKIFVNSMSDLFHKDVPLSFIRKVFKVMNKANWHNYQILTKRPERALELDKKLEWGNHIWLGATVEHKDYIDRIRLLKKTSAQIKFLSLEPLLSPLLNLDLRGINWVIVGGESGIGARPLKKEWVVDIKDQCLHNNVPFFFKQWGGLNKKLAGRVLDGQTYTEMPSIQEVIEPMVISY